MMWHTTRSTSAFVQRPTHPPIASTHPPRQRNGPPSPPPMVAWEARVGHKRRRLLPARPRPRPRPQARPHARPRAALLPFPFRSAPGSGGGCDRRRHRRQHRRWHRRRHRRRIRRQRSMDSGRRRPGPGHRLGGNLPCQAQRRRHRTVHVPDVAARSTPPGRARRQGGGKVQPAPTRRGNIRSRDGASAPRRGAHGGCGTAALASDDEGRDPRRHGPRGRLSLEGGGRAGPGRAWGGRAWGDRAGNCRRASRRVVHRSRFGAEGPEAPRQSWEGPAWPSWA